MTDLFDYVKANECKFSQAVNEATESTRGEALHFYTVVTDKTEDLDFPCVTLMLNLNVTVEFSEDGSPAVDMREIIDLDKEGKRRITGDLKTLYDAWKETQLKKQSENTLKRFVEAEEDRLKRRLTDPEYKQEQSSAIAYEKDIGPRYHNVIKLRFVGAPGNCVAVLDSWFYYSLPEIGKKVKTLFNNDLDKLFFLMKEFVFSGIGAKAFTLLDGWLGFNKGSKKFIASDDLQRTATKLVGAKPPVLREGWGDFDNIQRHLDSSPAHKSRETVRRMVSEGGYYGKFDFLTRQAFSAKFPEFDEDEFVQQAFFITSFGEPEERRDKLRICVADVAVVAIDAETEVPKLLKLCPFGSNPAKLLSQALGVDRAIVRVELLTQIDPQHVTLYDVCPNDEILLQALETKRLECRYTLEAPPKMQPLSAAGSVNARRSARLAQAEKKTLVQQEGALAPFVDTCF